MTNKLLSQNRYRDRRIRSFRRQLVIQARYTSSNSSTSKSICKWYKQMSQITTKLFDLVSHSCQYWFEVAAEQQAGEGKFQSCGAGGCKANILGWTMFTVMTFTGVNGLSSSSLPDLPWAYITQHDLQGLRVFAELCLLQGLLLASALVPYPCQSHRLLIPRSLL